MPSNLLIIGNGFDLACGLETKYIHYFHYVLNQSPEMNALVEFLSGVSLDDLSDETLDKHLLKILPLDSDVVTFWDVYFTFQDWVYEKLNTDQTWVDIEDMLLRSFKERETYDISSNIIFSAANCVKNNSIELAFTRGSIYRYLGSYVYRIFKKRNIKIGENCYSNYLEKELDRFSSNFSKYIKQQILKNETYKNTALKLVKKIIGLDKIDNYMIDSFNYTPIEYATYYRNIHGVAEDEDVVFGITCGEGEQRRDIHDDREYRFTKEYKIAKLMVKYRQPFNDYRHVKNVFIYGSSLGEQDYYYFESIFDKCEILEKTSSSQIIFVYSIYDKDKEEEIIDNITAKVTNIINMYGDRHNDFGLFRRLIQNGTVVIKKINS